MAVFEPEDELRAVRPPRLRTFEQGDALRARYLELFFDLVFVVAIAQLEHELVADHSLGGFATFAALYLPVFIAWQGFSSYADRFDTDDVVFRGVMLLAMLAIAALAIQIPDVSHGESTGFVVAYVILRSLLVAVYLRSYVHVPEARPLIGRYAWQYSIAIGIWMGSLALASPARYVLWGVALAWELSIPPRARRLWEAIPRSESKMPERLALFTIIVLGEAIVVTALGTSGSDWALSATVVAVLGFLVAAAIWWTYFGGGGEVTMRRSTAAIAVFVYSHIPLLAALTAVSAGISLAIEQSSGSQLDAGARWALAGGAALYLTFVTVAHASSTQGVPVSELRARIGAGLALVALALLGGALDPVVFMGAAASVLVGVVVLKLSTPRPVVARDPAPRPPSRAGRDDSTARVR
jgi:low temperature requirement protein LtrA